MTATKIVIVVFSLICIAETAWLVLALKKRKDMDTMRFQSQTVNLDDAKVAIMAYWVGDEIKCTIKGESRDLITAAAVLNARCILTLVKARDVHSIKDGIRVIKESTKVALRMPSVQNGFADVIAFDKAQSAICCNIAYRL